MSNIPSITEQEFLTLNPCGLNETFLSRLTACAEETFTELSEEETGFEDQLRSIRPRNTQFSLLQSLHGKIGDLPFAVDEKIVLFNKSNSRPLADSKRGRASNIFGFNLAAAAAVALLGSIAALMLPGNVPANSLSASSTPEAKKIELLTAPVVASNIAPAAYNQTLVETSDEGVIWQTHTKPLRVLRHTFNDNFTTADENGGAIEQQQPHVEYSLIPEKVD